MGIQNPHSKRATCRGWGIKPSACDSKAHKSFLDPRLLKGYRWRMAGIALLPQLN
jgi:hypothetical protein